jgi:L-cysteine:1D-myo-inositol 2-amino-2-deoxy-alpha-D-glucopyranoside ligase
MSQRPNEPGWQSSLGKGRPGWHIECTAIALAYLDPTDLEETLIDIQGGGSDLIFPHHEMCAAQAHVITGKELAANYVHAGMIGLAGEKMSKSKGNLVFVSRLVASGADPMVIRWALMSDHYRKDRMWSDSLLAKAESEVALVRSALNRQDVAPTDGVIDQLINALSDDLNTPAALSRVLEWSGASISGEQGGKSSDLKTALDAFLGLSL